MARLVKGQPMAMRVTKAQPPSKLAAALAPNPKRDPIRNKGHFPTIIAPKQRIKVQPRSLAYGQGSPVPKLTESSPDLAWLAQKGTNKAREVAMQTEGFYVPKKKAQAQSRDKRTRHFVGNR